MSLPPVLEIFIEICFSNTEGSPFQILASSLPSGGILVLAFLNAFQKLIEESGGQLSDDSPEYVGNVDGLGTLRILEAVRILGLEKKTKIYQASTSELYGGMAENKNERLRGR